MIRLTLFLLALCPGPVSAQGRRYSHRYETTVIALLFPLMEGAYTLSAQPTASEPPWRRLALAVGHTGPNPWGIDPLPVQSVIGRILQRVGPLR